MNETATALRLRWEAAKRRLDTLLAKYAAGQCGTAIVEAAEQAEDRAYNAWQAAERFAGQQQAA